MDSEQQGGCPSATITPYDLHSIHAMLQSGFQQQLTSLASWSQVLLNAEANSTLDHNLHRQDEELTVINNTHTVEPSYISCLQSFAVICSQLQ